MIGAVEHSTCGAQFDSMNLFAETLAKCSSHFVVEANGDGPTSYVTKFVFQIAVWPTFYKYFRCLLYVYLNTSLKSVVIGYVPHSIKLE